MDIVRSIRLLPACISVGFLVASPAAAQTVDLCSEANANVELGWNAYRDGATQRAKGLFARALKACPNHVDGLVGAGYAALRIGEPRGALTHFREALAIAPDLADAYAGEGLALNQLGQLDDAVVAFRAALSADPTHTEARLGLGRALAREGEFEEAVVLYGAVRREDPDDPRAVAALATVAGWQGRLVLSEALWQEAIALAPDDADSHVGLAVALRSQGRHRAALTALDRALDMVPDHAEAAEQHDAIRRGLAPRASVSGIYESDSDGNRVRTALLTAGWKPLARVELRWNGYVRESKVDRTYFRVRRAVGSRVALLGELNTGWRVRAGLGGAESNVPGHDPSGAFEFSAESPRESRLGGWVLLTRSPFDVTSPLIERGVIVRDLTLGLRADRVWAGRGGLTVSASSYAGSRPNGRTGVTGWFERPVGFATVGIRTNVFAFDADLNDGYFDPDRYWLAEMTVGEGLNLNRLRAEVTLAPGMQRVGSAGAVSGTARGELRLAVSLAPEREVWFRGIYSSTGLSGLTTEAADYRYKAVSAGVSWHF